MLNPVRRPKVGSGKKVGLRLTALLIIGGACAVSGCLFDNDSDEDSGVTIPPGSIEIVQDIYLTNAEPYDGPLPSPSGTAAAPVIEAAYFQNTGANSFVVVLDVGVSPIEKVYVELNGQVYVVDVEPFGGADGDITSVDACEIVAEAQGYTCTQACLEACGCVSCGDSTTEDAVEGACAATCSIASQQGTLSSEPYNGSEAIFADVTYNGYTASNGTTIDGVLDSVPCDGSTCAAAANADKMSYSFGFVAVDYGFISDLDVGSQIAEGPPQANTPSLTSDFNEGTLNNNACCKPFSECTGPYG